ncbi:hypothetical protein GUITHDRAFT_106883 [Guillardia theta CCMP2712]|uniref:Uncharacterized protein n=1 Tax=Guillardia theta (strain CCMP2712) TaxID=905079 RepID=L1JH68_GUITC|nr:hypothetical protein GUITHDRAFT_106883 [Guillardia theta CCMP2712]EKX47440.1 hypothetical protein GUITHDRAFT_106883 [Guillardia theta CCMP2712]|eukprot:XP_005834420.1 hypothetical protein GUITHDRAFT_106883 [Guillardia theta CCMP2712]
MEQARRSGVGLAFDHGSLRVDEILEGYSAMYSHIVEKGDKLVFVQGVPGQGDAQFPNNEFAKLFGEAIPGRQGTFVKMGFECSNPRHRDVEDTLYSKEFSSSWDHKAFHVLLMRGTRQYLLLVSRRLLLERTVQEFKILNEKLRGMLGMRTFNPSSVSMTTEELISSIYVNKDMISHKSERVNVVEAFGVFDRETNSVMGQTREFMMQESYLAVLVLCVNCLHDSQVSARFQKLPGAQSAFEWLREARKEQDLLQERSEARQRCKELLSRLQGIVAKLKKLEDQQTGIDVETVKGEKSLRMRELEKRIEEARTRQKEAIEEFEKQHRRRRDAELRIGKVGMASRAMGGQTS